MKVLRLELLMRRIELRYPERVLLAYEEAYMPQVSVPIGETYLPLLQPYRKSDSPNIRYASEFEIARLTGSPDVRAMIDAVEQQPAGQLRRDALAVLSSYMLQQFKSHGVPASPAEQSDLVDTLMKAAGLGLPASALDARQVSAVKKWGSFGLVEVRSTDSGYSALLEHRGTHWVYICVISSWIS